MSNVSVLLGLNLKIHKKIFDTRFNSKLKFHTYIHTHTLSLSLVHVCVRVSRVVKLFLFYAKTPVRTSVTSFLRKTIFIVRVGINILVHYIINTKVCVFSVYSFPYSSCLLIKDGLLLCKLYLELFTCHLRVVLPVVVHVSVSRTF